MVEHSAVNRIVIGSSPIKGGQFLSSVNINFANKLKFLYLIFLMV